MKLTAQEQRQVEQVTLAEEHPDLSPYELELLKQIRWGERHHRNMQEREE